MKTFLILFFAILAEVTGTSALTGRQGVSNGFTKPVPSIVVVIGYGASFYLLSLVLKVMSIGVAYAIWSGAGLILTVIAGIVLINVVSKSMAH